MPALTSRSYTRARFTSSAREYLAPIEPCAANNSSDPRLNNVPQLSPDSAPKTAECDTSTRILLPSRTTERRASSVCGTLSRACTSSSRRSAKAPQAKTGVCNLTLSLIVWRDRDKGLGDLSCGSSSWQRGSKGSSAGEPFLNFRSPRCLPGRFVSCPRGRPRQPRSGRPFRIEAQLQPVHTPSDLSLLLVPLFSPSACP